MYPRFTLATGALALVAAFPVAAADADSETIVVTATRFSGSAPNIPANITVISRQDIHNTPAQSIPDVLSAHAGIFVSELGGGVMGRNATVDMRGFGEAATSNTLILVDGLRVNPTDLGTIIWSSIPLGSVERIEIIRGSGSVLYGDGATGGVINIITNKSGNPVAGVTTTLGSYGYKSADIQLANGNDKAYYNLFVNYAESNGYRENSQQDQLSASGRVGLLLDHGEVFTDFAVYHETEGLPGSIFGPAYDKDPRSTRSPRNKDDRAGYRIRPGVAYHLNDRLTLEAEVAMEHQTLNSNFFSSFGDFTGDRVRDTTSFTPRLRWRHDLGALSSETVFGLDYYDGKVTSDNIGDANTGASQQSSAAYLQNITGLTQNLSLTVGGRSQRMDQKAHQDAYVPFFSRAMEGGSAHTQSAYDIGLAYAVDDWRMYGKTGTTFRFANLDELFGSDPITFAPVFAGELKPQHGTINEVGGSVAVGPVKLRASLFQLKLKDEIGFDGSANTNFSPTKRNGSELEADWKINDTWQAKASYSRTEAKFRDGIYSGNELPLVPRNQASAQLTWDTGSTGSYTALARYTGERRYGGDFANSQKMLDGYATLDLQANWNLKPWKITAKLLNTLNEKYSPFAGYRAPSTFYYYPADGRSFFVSARYDL